MKQNNMEDKIIQVIKIPYGYIGLTEEGRVYQGIILIQDKHITWEFVGDSPKLPEQSVDTSINTDVAY